MPGPLTESTRVEAFSDGVFAIAITLLVLDLKAPTSRDAFRHDLLAQWPAYVAYLASFGYIGVIWVNHHYLFTRIALYLLDQAGNRELVEVVRVLRSRSRLHGLRDSESAGFMRQNAREHLDLVGLIAEGRVNAVDDLLRRHLSAITAGWPAA